MKLIAVEITWYFIIGISALVVASGILLFWRENITNYIYCEIYLKIFPSGQVPEKCKKEEKIESISIFSKNEVETIRIFTSYLIKCWLDAEKYRNFKTHYCFKISFKGEVNFKIFPQNISKVLKDYDYCKTLQFKDYNCGYRNDIVWSVEKGYIDNNDIVIVKYLDTNQIEIIA